MKNIFIPIVVVSVLTACSGEGDYPNNVDPEEQASYGADAYLDYLEDSADSAAGTSSSFSGSAVASAGSESGSAVASYDFMRSSTPQGPPGPPGPPGAPSRCDKSYQIGSHRWVERYDADNDIMNYRMWVNSISFLGAEYAPGLCGRQPYVPTEYLEVEAILYGDQDEKLAVLRGRKTGVSELNGYVSRDVEGRGEISVTCARSTHRSNNNGVTYEEVLSSGGCR